MPSAATNAGASYVLPLTEGGQEQTSPQSDAALAEPLLRNSVEWFCRLRWIVVGLLVLLGLLGNNKRMADAAGLMRVGYWPFVCALWLAVVNAGFLWHARKRVSRPPYPVRHNLWLQIVLDLLVLTVVVHFVGSTTTFIAFAYLFHIVLACIFFPAGLSLLVTMLASGLFVFCVGIEQTDVISPQSIFPNPREFTNSETAFEVASAVLIWAAVWHLASHLATTVRQQGRELADANRRLLAAQEERARHMLVVTHQLKSPFAAVHANAQLLLDGYCGPMGEQALAVAQKITARCRRLGREIQEMLQLANLNSTSQPKSPSQDIDLCRLIRLCAGELDPTRQDRGIQLELDLQEVRAPGVQDHFRMLLGNLLSNAMAYSYPGGKVTVRCGPGPHGGACVAIADQGIGIEPQKLPRIFDEYYRTNEAAKHNPESSGLGLAIVKHVARMHAIEVRVESQVGAGTTFHLTFPRSSARPDGAA